MYFITTKRMLEVCFSAHPNIQYRTEFTRSGASIAPAPFLKAVTCAQGVLVIVEVGDMCPEIRNRQLLSGAGGTMADKEICMR